jgi:hypothetical protein
MKKIAIPVSVTFLLIVFAILSFNSAGSPSKNTEGLVNVQSGTQQDSTKLPSGFIGKFEP